jgi:hypothetical protein
VWKWDRTNQFRCPIHEHFLMKTHIHHRIPCLPTPKEFHANIVERKKQFQFINTVHSNRLGVSYDVEFKRYHLIKRKRNHQGCFTPYEYEEFLKANPKKKILTKTKSAIF